MRKLLLALLFAAPLSAQDTIRIREPVTMTVIPVADTVVRTVVDTVTVTQVDTVYAAGGVCREREKTRELRWFNWSAWETGDWQVVDCPGEVVPGPEPEEPTDPTPDPEPDPDPVEPTDPGDAWYVQDWDFPSVQAMFASPEVSDATFPGGGAVELLSGLTGTPTGFTRAVRARFDGGAGTEPQVGVNVHFPRADRDRPREVWVEFYTRWSTNWNVTGYPSHGSAGHKHMFLFDQRETGASGGRWELIYGSFNVEAYASISGETGPGRLRPEGVTSLWDGRWHLNRCHARMHPTDGTWNCTIGGYVVSWGSGDTDYGASLYFKHLALSRNNNQGTRVTMTLDFGPVYVFTSDPGWN